MSGSRPVIFLSSTVVDFADLRSAIRYFLEEFGFEVRTSEEADFPHPIDREAKAAAIAAIDGSDYYILIVGFRRGSLTNDGISITRAEFQAARELKRKTGRPHMLAFVRREVQTLRKTKLAEVPKQSTPEDWPAILEFLSEVESAKDPSDANWLQPFASYREIVSALRATLRISGPLPRMVAAANLRDELRANGGRLLRRPKGGVVRPLSNLLRRQDLVIPLDDIDAEVRIDRRVAAGITWLRMLAPRPEVLRDVALREAIIGGHFLEYQPATGRMEAGPVHKALVDLQEAVDQYRGLHKTLDIAFVAGDLETIGRVAKRDGPASGMIGAYTARGIWAFHADLESLTGLSRAVYRFLIGETTDVVRPTPVARVPNPELAAELEAEEVTPELADAWYRESVRDEGERPAL